MDLTEIRNRVIQKTGNRDPDNIDSEINFVQRQYIQPLARLPGEAYYTIPEGGEVTGEFPTTSDFLTHVTEYKPIKRGTLVIYDDMGDEIEEGAANYPEVNYPAGIFVFSAVEADVSVDYEWTFNSVSLSDVAADIYRLNYIADQTTGTGWRGVNLLNDFDTEGAGVRLYNDTLYFHNMALKRNLVIGYHRRLTDLSPSNLTPEIEEQWHDLYWLGAAAMLDPQYFGLFTGRLRDYKMDRISEGRPLGGKLKIGGWW